MQKKQLKLLVNGVLVTATTTGPMQPAHGKGFDGKTEVKSLTQSKIDGHTGKFAIGDAADQSIGATPDELLVVLRQIAPDWEITATKK